MSMPSTISTIEQFIARVGAGMSKSAEANTEAGSIGGPTEHPVKDVDDRTEDAKEGERSKENTADVKADQGAASVDSTPEATTKAGAFGRQFARGAGGAKRTKKADGGAVSQEGSAADDAQESVLNPQPTGQTPDIETSSAKPGKEDPGSSHPARTDNDSLDGHKYAADADPIKIASDLQEIGNGLLANLSFLSQGTQSAVEVQKVAAARGTTPAPATKQASVQIDPHVQMQIGYEMAGLINGTMDKAAADAMVENAIEQVIAESLRDAEKVAHYYDNFFAAAQQAQKQAEGEDPAAMAAMGGDPSGGGAPPPPPPGGGEGGMGEDDMMAALGGGADAGGMGGMGGDMGGGGGGDEAAALAQLLDQLGVTEEDLQQAMQEEAAGGGGGDAGGIGGDPSGGGAPPGGADAGGDKTAGDRRGNKTAAAKQGSFRNEIRDYLTEVLSRSRRK